MADAARSLVPMVEDELRREVPPAVIAMRDAILHRHPRGVAAMLFYGSCLRRADPTEGVQDFYLLVDDYRRFYGRRLPALANALLPPNVFYAECRWNGSVLRAKYAVVSMRQFVAGTSRRRLSSSLWARFAQPARLVLARDEAAAATVAAALAEAIVAMVEAAVPLLPPRFTARTLWEAGFQATYGAELRSEGPARAAELYAAERARYDAATAALATVALDKGFAVADAAAAPATDRVADPEFAVLCDPAWRRRGLWRWRLRRPLGKLLNLLRLIKGGFTFTGGLDYVLWKVERHSGVRITVSPWQRRHPLLGAPAIAWRLYRRGGFR